jgi:COP9 signalosome complex subunit 2
MDQTEQLADNNATIMDDTFIRSYIGDLLRSLRTQYLIDLIKPYTRLELSFLAKVCKCYSSQFRPLEFF